MIPVTLMGRGDDWKECRFDTPELWGTATCLVTPGLSEKNFTKVFAFDGLSFPEIQMAVDIAHERKIPIVGEQPFCDEWYPNQDIANRFFSCYFRNTISRMIAYALIKDYDKIYLYGIGGRDRWDYNEGKKYLLHWIGTANGKGVYIRIGQGSQRWLYARDKQGETFTNQQLADWHGVKLCASVS